MSEIDSFRHECIGMVSRPSSYLPNQRWRHPERAIPIYRLDEDALDADSFSGKKGDLLVGGGAGECPAFRISMPEAIYLFVDIAEQSPALTDVCHAYWSVTDAYILGDGYARLGWSPLEEPLESWLLERILAFVLRQYPEMFDHPVPLRTLQDTPVICRVPTAEEAANL